MSTTIDNTQLQRIIDMSEEDFSELVANNLHRSQSELWKLLHSPQLVHRTSRALGATYSDVCSQLSERKSELDVFRHECHTSGPDGKSRYFAAYSEYQAWKKRVTGYRRLLSTRIAETKSAAVAAHNARNYNCKPDPNRRKRQVSTVFELGWAIRNHQQASLDAEIKPEAHDIALWDALSTIEIETASGPVTVAEMLDNIAAEPGFVAPSDRMNI